MELESRFATDAARRRLRESSMAAGPLLLGVRPYEVWAMVRPSRDRLTDAVEVDETSVGGIEAGGGKRHVGKKALVVVAAEVAGPSNRPDPACTSPIFFALFSLSL
jgi:hypothetical protein